MVAKPSEARLYSLIFGKIKATRTYESVRERGLTTGDEKEIFWKEQ